MTEPVNKEQLPIFPLKLVLLPFEILPLHIFEPHYKKMISNAISDNSSFGIVLKDEENIYKIGCKAIVTRIIKEYPNGEYDVIVQGTNRFEIKKTFQDDKAIIGQIKTIFDEKIKSQDLIKEVHENYLKILIKLGHTNNLGNDLKKQISFEFVQNILLPLNLKKQLITSNSEKERIYIINKLFKKILSLSIDKINNLIPKA